MVKKMDELMRVDPDFKTLVESLKKNLEELSGKKFNHARTTKFIKETYPMEMIIRNFKKTRIREDFDKEFVNFLSF